MGHKRALLTNLSSGVKETVNQGIFCVAGLSHHTAGIEIREKFSFGEREILSIRGELLEAGIKNYVVLSTCNRTELYAQAESPEALREFFKRRINSDSLSEIVYLKSGREAFKHLFSVACGMDSQLIGETEILGQIKKAWQIAAQAKTLNALLNAAFQKAIYTGKRVRTETAISAGSLSLASLAVHVAAGKRPLLNESKIAVVGTGEMGRRIMRELLDYQPQETFIVSHTRSYAEEVAAEFGGRALSITEFPNVLTQCDIIFCASASPHPVLDRSLLPMLADSVAPAGLLVLDLGMPRNVEPELKGSPLITLYDLDDLKELATKHRNRRLEALPRAGSIVEEELQELFNWIKARRVTPLIKELQLRAREQVEKNLKWLLPKTSNLSEREKALVERMAERLAKGLLEPQIKLIKTVAEEEEFLEVFKEVNEINGGDQKRIETRSDSRIERGVAAG
ncbi:MAG: glutamyl-tRNA reductase [Candidatus Dadabacteria bacterium]|nr:MAG: glutamyl-tRNA reductase [Candidatus Dadabacteria bacterium]